MIFITGYGQMCNNMLQFGHFYAFARKNDIPIVGMRFCYKYLDFKISEEKGYTIFTYLFAKYGTKLKFIPKVEFNNPEEDQQEKISLLKNKKMILADGWGFRDYELFLSYREEIKALFGFKEKITKPVNAYLTANTLGKKRIGIHVRRGDYAKWHGGKYLLSDQEYATLVADFIVKEKIGNADIFIVTNDKNVDKAYFEQSLNQQIHLLNGSPAEDLYLLSCCDYIIGPPSTFSLMAAFYEDRDLYWIFDKNKSIQKSDFKKFAQCFRNII